MEETGTEREDVWGPIAMANWRETPCIQGRAATEDSAIAGRAVFFFDLSEGQESHSVDLDLPRCAILHEEGEGDLPVIVIQAEEGNNGTVPFEQIHMETAFCHEAPVREPHEQIERRRGTGKRLRRLHIRRDRMAHDLLKRTRD